MSSDPSGVFVIRRSSRQANSFVLCYRRDGTTINEYISVKDEGVYVKKAKKRMYFRSLSELVEYWLVERRSKGMFKMQVRACRGLYGGGI